MATIPEHELKLASFESPIQRVFKSGTLSTIVDELHAQQSGEHINQAVLEQGKAEYRQEVVHAQQRLHRVAEAIRPHMGDVYANGSEYENVTTKLYFKGHDLDYTADQHTDIAPELTQSGELGIPLPIESVPYKQEVINDFHTIPDIELFEKYYVDQVDNAGKVRPHSSWIGYTYTGESRHNLINKITLRVKTRESLGDKMADKAVNINSSRTSKISDLAGARIIAPNVSMAYETLGALQDLNGVHLVDTEKFGFVNDSIEDPKPNGYQDLKGFLATLEPNGMHGIVEYQVVTPKILKQNQQAKRSHQTYKFQKYNARLENIEEWNNVRSTIADLLGEENFQPLEKHELLQ